ncbi:DinB family protein [Aquiflexum sp.]|uniref:DinB family protein n=1 Tax=Aquiflexum sp. TaxID=1872584 RepID=UPI003592EF61
MKDTLINLFDRDLNKLKNELKLYKKEENIWKVSGDILNSAGTLTVHLIGNLNHFIGAVMGNSGYVRDRDAEFSTFDVPRESLIEQLDNTIQVVSNAILMFQEDKFDSIYPHEVFKEPMTHEYFLLHLIGHLNYHLGQVNYHRRLLDI